MKCVAISAQWTDISLNPSRFAGYYWDSRSGKLWGMPSRRAHATSGKNMRNFSIIILHSIMSHLYNWQSVMRVHYGGRKALQHKKKAELLNVERSCEAQTFRIHSTHKPFHTWRSAPHRFVRLFWLRQQDPQRRPTPATSRPIKLCNASEGCTALFPPSQMSTWNDLNSLWSMWRIEWQWKHLRKHSLLIIHMKISLNCQQGLHRFHSARNVFLAFRKILSRILRNFLHKSMGRMSKRFPSFLPHTPTSTWWIYALEYPWLRQKNVIFSPGMSSSVRCILQHEFLQALSLCSRVFYASSHLSPSSRFHPNDYLLKTFNTKFANISSFRSIVAFCHFSAAACPTHSAHSRTSNWNILANVHKSFFAPELIINVARWNPHFMLVNGTVCIACVASMLDARLGHVCHQHLRASDLNKANMKVDSIWQIFAF